MTDARSDGHRQPQGEARVKVIVHTSAILATTDVLSAFDAEFEYERFPYPEDTSPDEWLLAIGKERPTPIVLCLSSSIYRNSVGRNELRACGCTYVCLARGWRNMAWSEFCASLIRVWPDVKQILATTQPPALIQVPIKAKPFREPL